MKFILILLVFGINSIFASDSLYVISSTITNLDSLSVIQQQNVEWDSITTSTNHFVGENDSWYLLQVIGRESSGSFNVDTITVEDWKENYYAFFQTIIDTTQANIPPYDTLFQVIDYYSRTDTIPLIMLISEINTFCESALEDSTIYLDSNNIFEINTSSTTTKYCKEAVFMSTPSLDKYFGNLFKFIWTDEFYTINNYEDIDSVFLNFDDGNGFIHLPKDSIYQVIYETPGEKTITTKAKFTNSKELYSYSKIYINGEYLNTFGIPIGGDRINDIGKHYDKIHNSWDKRISIDDTTYWTGGPDDPVFHPEAYQIIKSNIEAYVYYGCGNNDFDKPFIIIEGIDQLNQMFPWSWWDTGQEWDFKNEECRDVKRIGMIEILEKNSRRSPDDDELGDIGIFSKLIKEGYDVVIVNHGNGGRPVKENGEFFARLMKKINNEKTGNNKSIVMGASMGGLTSRIGLALLEQESPSYDHKVSHFITVDSPHRGAWINAATQIHLQASERQRTIKKQISSQIKRLNSEASKDLLIHYFTDNQSQYNKTGKKLDWWKTGQNWNNLYLKVDYNTGTDLSGIILNNRKEFQDYLDILGYPENLIKVAVSNGSFNNSNQSINLNNSIFDAVLKSYAIDMRFELKAFPKYGETVKIVDSDYDLINAAFLKGESSLDLNIQFSITNNDENLNFSLDNMPGGNIPLIKEFEGIFESYFALCGGDDNYEARTGSILNTSQRVSAFIPTASSIDLRKNMNFELDHQYQYFNDNIRTLLSSGNVYTPFDYIYGLDYNSDHAFANTDMGNGLSPTEYSTRRNALVDMIDDLLENNFKDIYIQNETIDDTRSYKTNYSIKVGRDVMSDISSLVNRANTAIGDVVFTNNSDVQMEAAEEIVFENGTYINSGAELHAKIIPAEILDCEVSAKVVYNNKKEIDEPVTYLSEINIFPNPVKSEFQIKVNSNDNIRRMYILNLTGQMVIDLTSSIKNDFKSYDFLLESSNLSSGAYIFVIEGEKETTTKNFVITK